MISNLGKILIDEHKTVWGNWIDNLAKPLFSPKNYDFDYELLNSESNVYYIPGENSPGSKISDFG
jgi:hypothetical protein